MSDKGGGNVKHMYWVACAKCCSRFDRFHHQQEFSLSNCGCIFCLRCRRRVKELARDDKETCPDCKKVGIKTLPIGLNLPPHLREMFSRNEESLTKVKKRAAYQNMHFNRNVKKMRNLLKDLRRKRNEKLLKIEEKKKVITSVVESITTRREAIERVQNALNAMELNTSRESRRSDSRCSGYASELDRSGSECLNTSQNLFRMRDDYRGSSRENNIEVFDGYQRENLLQHNTTRGDLPFTSRMQTEESASTSRRPSLIFFNQEGHWDQNAYKSTVQGEKEIHRNKGRPYQMPLESHQAHEGYPRQTQYILSPHARDLRNRYPVQTDLNIPMGPRQPSYDAPQIRQTAMPSYSNHGVPMRNYINENPLPQYQSYQQAYPHPMETIVSNGNPVQMNVQPHQQLDIPISAFGPTIILSPTAYRDGQHLQHQSAQMAPGYPNQNDQVLDSRYIRKAYDRELGSIKPNLLMQHKDAKRMYSEPPQKGFPLPPRR